MEIISSQIEERRKLLVEEKAKIASNQHGNNGEDELDAYLSGLSSQLGDNMHLMNLFQEIL